ncbi:hypothetical protein SAMN05216359_11461 [Roseateles sp. YR242]|uniref:hypothetical protein n=1 Tax=Roseateles sp. YR242 TaxID=1855305 RepID=UPI0008CCE8B7|nr:hypothetical protein [Roseateles sp. YR242]SEL70398.1 hypothetical protein SAMN05216359_11461 [Roseateles sp. YR242]
MTKPRSASDFPPGLQGGMEHDSEDHRVGETGQTGPESPGDVDRSHPSPVKKPTQAPDDEVPPRPGSAR